MGAPIALDLVPDKPSPQSVGSKIMWTSKAVDLQGDTIYYRFWLRGPATGNVWKMVQDWSTSDTWIWETSESDIGSNKIEVEQDKWGSYQIRDFEIVE